MWRPGKPSSLIAANGFATQLHALAAPSTSLFACPPSRPARCIATIDAASVRSGKTLHAFLDADTRIIAHTVYNRDEFSRSLAFPEARHETFRRDAGI